MSYLLNIGLFCLVGTIIIETLIAFLIGIRNKKDILNIILVNLITNPIVFSIPLLIASLYGPTKSKIIFYLLEVLTVLFEGFIYSRNLQYRKINSLLLSLLLNLCSYLLGLILLPYIY